MPIRIEIKIEERRGPDGPQLDSAFKMVAVGVVTRHEEMHGIAVSEAFKLLQEVMAKQARGMTMIERRTKPEEPAQ